MLTFPSVTRGLLRAATDKSEMNRKFARLQLNFVASSPDGYPAEKIEDAIILPRVPESFYPRARLSSRMMIFGATRPVFCELQKMPKSKLEGFVVDGIAQPGLLEGPPLE